MKEYQTIEIKEENEPLIAIPPEFPRFEPHPYVLAGADYRGISPWQLRQSVVNALQRAQAKLNQVKPGWKLYIFDAYRPNFIQQFMVDLEYLKVAKEENIDPAKATAAQKEFLFTRVYRILAIPSDDPKTPPPHSTGAAVDCTLMDEKGQEVFMGSPIDENSNRSNPDYFTNSDDPAALHANANRVLLNNVMASAGFRRNPTEWWHFSMGDQYAALLERRENPQNKTIARYGRADLI